MKLRIISSVIIAGVIITGVVAHLKSDNVTNNLEASAPQKVKRENNVLPNNQPVNQTGYKPHKRDLNLPIKQAISMEDLVGHVNKEYGIREDILRYIERAIPPDNESAKKTAIKLAERSQYIYYKSSKKQAIKAVSQLMISLECLRYFLKDQDPTPVADSIDKLMRNTPERNEHLWHIDKTYFGWEVLGHEPISEKKLVEICKSGDY